MKLTKNRQYTVRLMAPFNMRCKTCGEYIYKGKKFNARKEDVENEIYLNIRIYRFYIKCPRCLQEISFKTDTKNTDYEIEAGATRNLKALKLAEEQARREEEEAREEETNNPMKLLENRTQQSKNEIELLESLEELRDLNRRQEIVDYDLMLKQYNREDEMKRILEMQQKEDEETIKSMRLKHKRLQKGDTKIREETIETMEAPAKIKKPNTTKMEVSTSQSARNRTKKNILSNIIKRKLPDENVSKPDMEGALDVYQNHIKFRSDILYQEAIFRATS
uniref:Splicing factor YJU2 n=1 Tax=Glossina brevipalpis TaxID=37001 RepID=A0A1A9WIF4_9MUSC